MVLNDLSMDKLMGYMFDTLSMVSHTQTLAGLDAATLASMGYEKLSCAWLKERYKSLLSAHIAWQVEAWMDPVTCALRTQIDYLAYSAI